jgi:hypothetical protein
MRRSTPETAPLAVSGCPRIVTEPERLPYGPIGLWVLDIAFVAGVFIFGDTHEPSD